MTVTARTNEDLVLWYESPALRWEEALPIGNGRLGAMIFGAPCKEHLQLNEDTIWTGKPHDYSNKGAHRYLDTIRELIKSGRQQEAEALAMEKFMSIPLGQKAYQPFCDLHLDFPGLSCEEVASYRRELDLEQAISSVRFEHQGVKYRREYLASHPHQAIFIHCDADQDGKISFDARLTSPHKNVLTVADQNGITLRGEVEPGGIRFEARITVVTDGGDVTTLSDSGLVSVSVRKANSATIAFVGASSFVNYKDISGNPKARCEQYLGKLTEVCYEQVKQEHIIDYQGLFRTVSLDFGSSAVGCPTDQRIKRFSKTSDSQLVALYFQYGRYLMISGSRPRCMPLNLQGIWNDNLYPPWDSKFTCNINLEMNYWPAEPANLSVCHQPLFELIKVVRETGSIVAKEHYNCRGWVLHHNTDIWGGSAPINASDHGIWPTGGAWLCSHIWQHYLYNQDLGFLEEYYPIMRDAALFFVDFLVEDQETGWLISTPSNSPEQGGLVAGPTMDHQIIRDLFRNCINASRVLGIDSELRIVWQDIVERIAPNQIGKYGQLQEWLTDIDDPLNEHRHVSHLWGLHPGSEISPEIDPDFSEAARKSLEFRGDKGTGWSMAWKINLWARLGDGDRAYKLMTNLIDKGTYPNMLDAHPPFQIDGNFGATAGIIEMLLQSHLGHLSLLPALPSSLPQGEAKGLCAVGGFTVDISWANGKLVTGLITSKFGNECRVRYGEAIEVYNSSNELVPLRKLTEDVYAFDTKKGQTYRVVNIG
ncbi:MAG: glycoside hydrolase family 95 protein [Firmicutes bacterium]|nr:glycoside hydrolase family 95 protein [Bacillota bacterium]